MTTLLSRNGSPFAAATQPSSLSGDLFAVAYSGAATIDAVGYVADSTQGDSHCATTRSEDGGNTWVRLKLCGNAFPVYAAWGSDTGVPLIAGASGIVYVFQPNVDQWDEHGIPSGPDLHGIWAKGSDAFAVGDNGAILKSSNGGIDWSVASQGAFAGLTAIWGTNNHDIYAVGVAGTVLHYDGTKWTSLASGITDNLRGISGRGSEIIAVGDRGTILRSTDGVHLVAETSGTQQNLRAVWLSPSGDDYSVGEAGTLLHRSP
jgi:photosystem II stability/assembly factor-like uncharacterized protein